jgi:hypothetical protein
MHRLAGLDAEPAHEDRLGVRLRFVMLTKLLELQALDLHCRDLQTPLVAHLLGGVFGDFRQPAEELAAPVLLVLGALADVAQVESVQLFHAAATDFSRLFWCDKCIQAWRARTLIFSRAPEKNNVPARAGLGRWQMPTYRKAVITGLLREPVWSCLREKLKFLKYVHTVENGFEVYAQAEEPLREVAWQKLFPGAHVQIVTGLWEDSSRYRMLHAQGQFITLGTPQRKAVLADRRKDRALVKPLRDEAASGSDDSADERERKRRREAENEENEENTPSADEQRALAAQAAAQAAEVRALRLATAGALVQQRAAFLALVTARRDMVHGKSVSSSEQSVLERSVTQARANTAVAQAREELAKAKLQALQLATEIVVRASAE